MKRTSLHLFSTFLLIILLLRCVQDDDFSTPIIECIESTIQTTTSIQQVKEMYTFGAPKVIDSDVIIEGYVVSSDKSGNIYKTLSIQDKPENPTAAIKIAIDQTDMYAKYNIGRKIFVNLKGLAIGNSFGSLQIGKTKETELDRIPALEVNKHIMRSCEVAEIIPKKVHASQLDETLIEMLVEIENVQFSANELGNSYGNVDNSETVDRILEVLKTDCTVEGKIILRNSGFSQFKNQLIPQGKGSLIAILSNYYDDLQLYIREPEDVNFTESRCKISSEIQTNSTLSAIRTMYQGTTVEFGIHNNFIIEGYVISTDRYGNFKNKLVVQDKIENPQAGIQILLDREMIFENYSLGDKIFLKLNKLYMSEQEGLLTIGYPKGNKITEIPAENVEQFIVNSYENYDLLPKEISIEASQNPLLESTLVKISNIQLIADDLGSAYAYFSGTTDGIQTLESCNETTRLSVFTSGEATFANEPFPEGRGTITGVLGSHLVLRSEEDVQFIEPFEVCPIKVPKIMITEVADPKNNVSARFVELHNAGDSEINLTGWKLNKYINGNTSVSGSSIDLSAITIPIGGFVIIGNSDYGSVFNDPPDITSTYISGNGDDVYELVDRTGQTMDVFGRIGEDGNGTDWEYLDGRAIRHIEISEPNPVFAPSEWIISTIAANDGVTNPNKAQNAPEDFNPRVR
jgi:hypothetical protein